MTDPMRHPGDEHLACYVDGSLSASQHAAVARHLDTCSQCAAEVAAASAARAALARLETVEAPAGIASHALAESSTKPASTPTGRTATPGWYRWGGAAAVAAGFALVLILVLPRFGGQNDSTAPGREAAARSGPVTVEVSGQDFQPAEVRRLAADFVAGRTTGGIAPEASGIAPTQGPAVIVASTGPQHKVVGATACVKKAFRQVDGTLVRLIQAKFQGEPAYLALYTSGSSQGQSDAAVTVRVAAIDGCTPLTITGASMPAASP